MPIFQQHGAEDNFFNWFLGAIVEHMQNMAEETITEDGKRLDAEKLAANFMSSVGRSFKFYAEILWCGNETILELHDQFSEFIGNEIRKGKKIDTEEFILLLAKIFLEWLRDPRIEIYQSAFKYQISHHPKDNEKKYPKNIDTFYTDRTRVFIKKLEELCACKYGSREEWLKHFDPEAEIEHLYDTGENIITDFKSIYRDICSTLVSFCLFELTNDWQKFADAIHVWMVAASENEDDPSRAFLRETNFFPERVKEIHRQFFATHYINDQIYWRLNEIRDTIKYILTMIKYILSVIKTKPGPWSEEVIPFWWTLETQLSKLDAELDKMNEEDDYMGLIKEKMSVCGKDLCHIYIRFLK